MGCCSSAPAEDETGAAASIEDVKTEIRKEVAEQRASGEQLSFLGSVVAAIEERPDDTAVLLNACTRLQEHNRKLKSYVATLDATACHSAMKGGMLGLGCNDKKLIAATCTRTKSQLAKTAQRYRALYGRDLREDIKGETGGNYGRLIYYAMSSRPQYVSEMISLACEGIGCDEVILIETFATCTTAELRQGKAAWEGKSDRSLVDYLNSELGSGHEGLRLLLLKLLKGDVSTADGADDAVAVEQAATLHAAMEGKELGSLIRIVGGNTFAQNSKLASAYEQVPSLLPAMRSPQCGVIAHCGSAMRSPQCRVRNADSSAARSVSGREGRGPSPCPPPTPPPDPRPTPPPHLPHFARTPSSPHPARAPPRIHPRPPFLPPTPPPAPFPTTDPNRDCAQQLMNTLHARTLHARTLHPSQPPPPGRINARAVPFLGSRFANTGNNMPACGVADCAPPVRTRPFYHANTHHPHQPPHASSCPLAHHAPSMLPPCSLHAPSMLRTCSLHPPTPLPPHSLHTPTLLALIPH